ncbi:hypothetical protein H0H92_001856, partial [Tricholoma furcatifolium]
ALDCEEDIRLLIVSELLLGHPAQTFVSKHTSHIWSKGTHMNTARPADSRVCEQELQGQVGVACAP